MYPKKDIIARNTHENAKTTTVTPMENTKQRDGKTWIAEH
jgi:hypothetical protein